MSNRHHSNHAFKLAELYVTSFLWILALSCVVGWVVFYGFPDDLGRDYFASQLFLYYRHPWFDGLSLGQFVTFVSASSFWWSLLPFALVLMAKARSLIPTGAWRIGFYLKAIYWFVAVAMVTYAFGVILFQFQRREETTIRINDEMELFRMSLAAMGWLLLLPSIQLRRRS